MSNNDDVQVWRYTLPNVNHGGWAIFLLDSTGTFTVVSDFGNYAYKWPDQDWGPDGGFRGFLCRLDQGYLCGKLNMGHPKEFQPDETRQVLRETILRYRREGYLSKERARDEWEAAKTIQDEHSFSVWYDQTRLEDAYEYACYDVPGQLVGFYERVYKRLVELLRRELAEEASAA